MGRPPAAVHAERVIKAIAGDEAASSALAASWSRSGRLHALDPASAKPTLRVERAGNRAARERIGRLLGVAEGFIDRLNAAVGGVGCSVVARRPRRRRRRAPRRASDDKTFEGLGPVDVGGLEREVRGHQRHRHLPRRGARGDDRPRSAFLHPQHAPRLHDGADLRRARRTRGGARHLVVPRRSRPRASSGCLRPRWRTRRAPSRPKISGSPFPRERILLARTASGRLARRCSPSTATISSSARRAPPASRSTSTRTRSADPAPPPTSSAARMSRATTSARPSGPCCNGRWRAPTATCRGRRRICECRAPPFTGRSGSSASTAERAECRDSVAKLRQFTPAFSADHLCEFAHRAPLLMASAAARRRDIQRRNAMTKVDLNIALKSPFKPRYENFIGGEWRAPKAGKYFDNISPITGHSVGEIARSDASDVEAALDAAHAAKDAWGRTCGRRARADSQQDRRPDGGQSRDARARRDLGQRQADPRVDGRRHPARHRPLPLFRRRGARAGRLDQRDRPRHDRLSLP